MIDDLTSVLQRQLDAASALERRLRATELLIENGEHRFLAMAVDEVTTASDRLAALELTRTLLLRGIGAPDEVSGSELADAVDGDAALRFTDALAALRTAVARVTVRRERVRHLLESARDEGRARLETAGVA